MTCKYMERKTLRTGKKLEVFNKISLKTNMAAAMKFLCHEAIKIEKIDKTDKTHLPRGICTSAISS